MQLKVSEIIPFGKNKDYFDDITGQDFEDLKQSILENGIIEPIVVNQDHVVICGHQRLRAAIALGLDSVPCVVRHVADKHEHETLLIEENLRRRQLSTSQMARAIKRLYEIRGIDRSGGGAPNHREEVTSKIADDLGKSKATITRLRTLADLIPELSALLDGGKIKQGVAYQFAQLAEDAQREINLTLRESMQLAKVNESEAKKIKDQYQSQTKTIEALTAQISDLRGKLPTESVLHKIQRLETLLEQERGKPPAIQPPADYDEIKDRIKKLEREKAKQRRDYEDTIARMQAGNIALPQKKYKTIVVDPPWPVQKIMRDCRPDQAEFAYATMPVEQIMDYPIESIAEQESHLYLWTTHKHLPDALRIAKAWGFSYQCLMTWNKNVGITPFSWMYSTEHVLFCHRGGLKLLKQGMRLDFAAPVREHSRKPDEFYAIVKECSPEPRIDVFSREPRDGFDQHGNETCKFEVSNG